MLEIPEATTIARQMALVEGRRVQNVTVFQSPHKFAFFSDGPEHFPAQLMGQTFAKAKASGGLVEAGFDSVSLSVGDGANPRYTAPGQERPAKHQLLLELDDGAAISFTIAMYGFFWVGDPASDEDHFRGSARVKPNPLTEAFDAAYFEKLRADTPGKLSLKAFLATEQRIPGLGNGVLQDILYNARLHPKRKLQSLSDAEFETLYQSVKNTLAEMMRLGGRDIEKDFFGAAGGYQTKCGRNTLKTLCPVCGGAFQKAAYMGGSVYWCEGCQKE